MDPWRGERIARLPDHPAWADLQAEIEAQENDFWAKQTDRLRRRPLTSDELGDLDRRRWFYEGMREILKFPDLGQKAIDRAIARKDSEEP